MKIKVSRRAKVSNFLLIWIHFGLPNYCLIPSGLLSSKSLKTLGLAHNNVVSHARMHLPRYKPSKADVATMKIRNWLWQENPRLGKLVKYRLAHTENMVFPVDGPFEKVFVTGQI